MVTVFWVLDEDDVVGVAGGAAVEFDSAVLVACFELPQPASSASPAKMARIGAPGLKDRCITADIDLVDEATP